MIKKVILCIIIAIPSQAAILWGENGPAPIKKSRFNYDRTQEAQEISQFWANHKMGVGMATAGAYGLIGGTVAVHFHPNWAVDLGYGGGSHFHSFGFRVRRMLLMSSPLNPYVGFGFNRWERTTTRPFNAADISPGYVAKEFMSEADRNEGRIDERLIHATVGIQYVFTQGQWRNYGVFLEALFMMSVEDYQSAPTASLGFNYFF